MDNLINHSLKVSQKFNCMLVHYLPNKIKRKLPMGALYMIAMQYDMIGKLVLNVGEYPLQETNNSGL